MENYGNLVSPSTHEEPRTELPISKSEESQNFPQEIPSKESIVSQRRQTITEKTQTDGHSFHELVINALKDWSPGKRMVLAGVCITPQAFKAIKSSLAEKGWSMETYDYNPAYDSENENQFISEMSPRIVDNDDPDRELYQQIIIS